MKIVRALCNCRNATAAYKIKFIADANTVQTVRFSATTKTWCSLLLMCEDNNLKFKTAES